MANVVKVQPVLVAVDFSDDSEAALVWGCVYARLVEAPLAVLHVVHDPASAPGFYRRQEPDWVRPMSEVASELFGEFLKDVRGRHRSVAEFDQMKQMQVVGLPATRIVEVAGQENAQLVVVGSKGRTGFSHVMLGSVAERVVQVAQQPVTVVKAGFGSEVDS